MAQVRVARPLFGELDLSGVPGAEVRFGPRQGHESREAFLAFMRGADAVVSWFTDRIDDEFLDAVGPQLRVIAQYAVGHDNIDIEACTRRGVVVTNTPDAVTDGTADTAVMLLLAAARRLSEADRFARSGEWERRGPLGPDEFIGRPISGGTLLIVGAGRIGHATALRMCGWGMRTLYVSRRRKPEFELPPLNGERVELDEGLRLADFVSLHTPLTAETRHLIDARRLGLMKPTAVLVNTARGPVVDEAALATALADGTIYAAGLDVFENEPAIHAGLRELPNAVMAPHFGSANAQSRARMTELCAENVVGVLAGGGPVTPVG